VGDEVKRVAALAAAIAGLPAPALAQGQPAAGLELFYSSDAEHSEVLKARVDFDLRYSGPDNHLGVRFERARFTPLGQRSRTMARGYVSVADDSAKLKWNATVGTDGHTLIGAASIHDESAFRKEAFIERDIVETPIGVSRGIYYTVVGAAVDLPADDRNIFTGMAGVQGFTGKNTRLHVRGNYVHVLKPSWGLSAQLRSRYFHSSSPGEFDYYSPRWYAEVLPVVQLRRFIGGWQLLGAAGYGAQRDPATKWRSSRYLNARFTSPAAQKRWAVTGSVLYANTPVNTGFTYRYLQLGVGLTKAL
jgi:hypothetical protein